MKPKKQCLTWLSQILGLSKVRNAKRKSDPEAGWTFIEIIVVLAIILILTATVGVLAFQYIGQANTAAAKTQIQTFSMALNSYMYTNGKFPSQEQGLKALWQKPNGEPVPNNWTGPYLEKEPGNDPWGHPYQYKVPGPNGLPFGVFSYGADGVEGGEADNADITSWQ